MEISGQWLRCNWFVKNGSQGAWVKPAMTDSPAPTDSKPAELNLPKAMTAKVPDQLVSDLVEEWASPALDLTLGLLDFSWQV